MRQIGSVEMPQEAFLSVLKLDDEQIFEKRAKKEPTPNCHHEKGNNMKNKRNFQKNQQPMRKDEEKSFDDQIEGRNSVLELLESGKDINKIFVTRGEKHGSINKILAIAKERKIIVVEKDKRQMDEMAQEENYQGVIAIVPPFEYVEIEDILNIAKERNDQISKITTNFNPQNKEQIETKITQY